MSETIQQPVISLEPEPTETSGVTVYSALVGINEAARITKRSKGQISKDTASGRLSHETDERGQKRYMVAELDRLYGLKTSEGTSSHDREKPDDGTTATAVEIAVLRERNRALEEQNRALREDKQRLWETTQQLTGRLLEVPAAQPQSAAAPPASKTLWQRITGK